MARWQLLSALLALALSLTALLNTASQISEKVEQFSFARSDSDAWNFAQVEVAYKRFQIALFSALREAQAHGKLPSEAGSEIRQQFDIFYSRVDTVADRYDMFAEQVQIEQALNQVLMDRNRLTKKIDAEAFRSTKHLIALLKITEEMRTGVRELALQAMHTAIEDQEKERKDIYSALRTYFLSLLALIFLLSVVGLLFVYLSRILTAKNSAERNLTAYREKLLQAAGEGIIVLDWTLKIIDANQSAEHIFGYDHHSLIGCDAIEQLAPKLNREYIDAHLHSFFEDQSSLTQGIHPKTIIARRKNGKSFPAELRVTRVTDQMHRKVLVAFVRDLSSERQARLVTRKALAQAQQDAAAKQRFLSTMSHEMRTPLHSIVVATDMVHKGDKQHAYYLNIIQEAARAALQQVEDILEIAKSGQNMPTSGKTLFDAASVAENVIVQMKPLAQFRGDRLVFRWAGPRHLYGSPRDFLQILRNLISNAIKATADGTIEVLATEATLAGQPALQVAISDNGIGIPNKDRDTVFEDFVSSFPSQSKNPAGTGLGLGIVKRTTAAMEGQIEFESELGRGTIFRVTIPAPLSTDLKEQPDCDPANVDTLFQTNEAEPQHLSELRRNVENRLRVLVVEDHPTNRRLLERILLKLGHWVVSAADGLEGLEKGIASRFDLILTDLNMPHLAGENLARCLRHSRYARESCIIAVTAKTTMTKPQRVSVQAGGIDAILFKPFDMERLNSVICDALEERKYPTDETYLRASNDKMKQGPVRTDELNGPEGEELKLQAQHDLMQLLEQLPEPQDKALTLSQFDELARSAHYVAGSFLVLGLHNLGQALLDVEQACDAHDFECLRGLSIVLHFEAREFLGTTRVPASGS